MANGHLINLLSGEIAQELGRKPRYEDCYVVQNTMRLLFRTPVEYTFYKYSKLI